MNIEPQAHDWPIQIDPIGCGCTECLIGEHVPLDQATEEQINKMIAGEIEDATSISELAFDKFITRKFG